MYRYLKQIYSFWNLNFLYAYFVFLFYLWWFMVFMLFCSIYHLLSKCLSCIRVEKPFILDITSGYVWTTDTQPFFSQAWSLYNTGINISPMDLKYLMSMLPLYLVWIKILHFMQKFCKIHRIFREYVALPDNISFCIIISLQKRNYMSVVQDQSAI